MWSSYCMYGSVCAIEQPFIQCTGTGKNMHVHNTQTQARTNTGYKDKWGNNQYEGKYALERRTREDKWKENGEAPYMGREKRKGHSFHGNREGNGFGGCMWNWQLLKHAHTPIQIRTLIFVPWEDSALTYIYSNGTSTTLTTTTHLTLTLP